MDLDTNRASEPTAMPSQPSQPSQPRQDVPEGIGLWIGVAALTVVLLAFVWLR